MINDNDINNIIQDTNVSSTELTELALELPAIKCPNGKKCYQVTKKQVDEWQDTYIGVDVMQELKRMKVWLEANPKSQKTYIGIPRFIIGWLNKAQDQASRYNKNIQGSILEKEDNEYEIRDGKKYIAGFEEL